MSMRAVHLDRVSNNNLMVWSGWYQVVLYLPQKSR